MGFAKYREQQSLLWSIPTKWTSRKVLHGNSEIQENRNGRKN